MDATMYRRLSGRTFFCGSGPPQHNDEFGLEQINNISKKLEKDEIHEQDVREKWEKTAHRKACKLGTLQGRAAVGT